MYWLRKYKGGNQPTIPVAVTVLENIGQAAVRVRLDSDYSDKTTRVVNADRLVSSFAPKKQKTKE